MVNKPQSSQQFSFCCSVPGLSNFASNQIFVMGNLIQPSCTCGFLAVPMMQGLGDSFFESGIYYEPAWCSNCTMVEPKNGNEKEPTCSTCHDKIHFYKRGYASPNTTSILPDTNYLRQKKYWFCPACKKEKLEFIFVGLWVKGQRFKGSKVQKFKSSTVQKVKR